MSAPQGVQHLIEKAQAHTGGIQYSGSVTLQKGKDHAYASVPFPFVRQQQFGGEQRVERYVDYDARAVVMFFPEDSEDE